MLYGQSPASNCPPLSRFVTCARLGGHTCFYFFYHGPFFEVYPFLGWGVEGYTPFLPTLGVRLWVEMPRACSAACCEHQHDDPRLRLSQTQSPARLASEPSPPCPDNPESPETRRPRARDSRACGGTHAKRILGSGNF